MTGSVPFAEVWRGELLESVHNGHAVICDDRGEIIEAWGDPEALIYPRSSCKMVQALPLIESGAANAFGLTPQQLALACASHNAAYIHTKRVTDWLDQLGLGDDDFRCGPQLPPDKDARNEMIRAGETPCQVHNNCSGKHAGFLTLNKHLGTGPEYVEIDHPLQVSIKSAFEETTGEDSPLWAIDGCSAPNHASTVRGLATAMAGFASASTRGDARSNAMVQLVDAMIAHPDLVAGEGRACTGLMRACEGRAAIKTGAEGVFVAILPELKRGVALKITDGATRASECAITAILIKLGVLDANHPVALEFGAPIQKNRRGLVTGQIRPAAILQ